MIQRRSELSSNRIDREWPYQVALPAAQVMSENYSAVHRFCTGLSLCPRGHTAQRAGIDYQVFCFAEPPLYLQVHRSGRGRAPACRHGGPVSKRPRQR
jgi:hypothetical protein